MEIKIVIKLKCVNDRWWLSNYKVDSQPSVQIKQRFPNHQTALMEAVMTMTEEKKALNC
jgi:hypothetical protein